jgi:anti-anti-sigma factor
MDASRSALKLHVERLDAREMEITAVGELDESTVNQLRACLLDHPEGGPDRILLNLTRLDFIDSAGLALLILARIEIEAGGGKFVVQTREPRVRRALRIAGIERFVTLAEDRVAALAALRPAA